MCRLSCLPPSTWCDASEAPRCCGLGHVFFAVALDQHSVGWGAVDFSIYGSISI